MRMKRLAASLCVLAMLSGPVLAFERARLDELSATERGRTGSAIVVPVAEKTPTPVEDIVQGKRDYKSGFLPIVLYCPKGPNSKLKYRAARPEEGSFLEAYYVLQFSNDVPVSVRVYQRHPYQSDFRLAGSLDLTTADELRLAAKGKYGTGLVRIGNILNQLVCKGTPERKASHQRALIRNRESLGIVLENLPDLPE